MSDQSAPPGTPTDVPVPAALIGGPASNAPPDDAPGLVASANGTPANAPAPLGGPTFAPGDAPAAPASPKDAPAASDASGPQPEPIPPIPDLLVPGAESSSDTSVTSGTTTGSTSGTTTTGTTTNTTTSTTTDVAAPKTSKSSGSSTVTSYASNSTLEAAPTQPSAQDQITSKSIASRSDRYDICSYSIVIRTSSQENAGSNGNVFVQLTDSEDQKTDKLRLKYSITHRRKFKRGHADLFLLVDQNPLVDIKHIDVWHESRAMDPSSCWLLHSVNVIEHQTHQLFRFNCNKWLGAQKDGSNVNHTRLDVVGEPYQVLVPQDFSITG